MSAFSEVLNFVRENGKCTTAEVCDGLNQLDVRTVQRALERLVAVDHIQRNKQGRTFIYFIDEPFPTSETGRPVELAKKAHELEERGMNRRAATLWLEAFDCAQTQQARASYAKRRAKCLAGMKRGVTDAAGSRWNETSNGGSQ
ncbi:BlaI/MecI/CopY family transcriptional regulator [Kosakonia sp. ML.JS2a]|uniref:BlaI/MecI/CopY family transcriptional regulator n=1 Tax=Kosakonia sp. ML.JS2a TaxID=2980557 RepID=UPI0021D9BFAA|nr:BlaI/MecI/CopY family transcriptional regulator [Kosakonia sp. ML.JS2a]UXY12050.1 BlaI/MecI/CopY family transcriptional regulator [Kosakonia sp. ML.JS2a]